MGTQPGWLPPMLATLKAAPFSARGWVFERKLDGERVLGYRVGSRVQLLTRNQELVNDAYPEIAEALGRQRHELVVDGEVVAFEGTATSFSALQRRMQVRDPWAARMTGVRVFYYLFDLLWIDGELVTDRRLLERKRLLKQAVTFSGPLRFSVHQATNGERFLAEACDKGWEGIIAKRADGAYVHRRSQDWLKLKCVNEQEFVIGGYTDPKGTRKGLGALLLGYYEGGRLKFAGEVGTGFDNRMLADLVERLGSLEQSQPPFDANGLPRRGVHWVRPQLVAQVGFTEWTRDGKLRHPRFRGLRRDKRATDVVREVP
jgi:DNA ligase D-like protein (predicted ligase)